jgi:translation elongation factor EF-4
MAQSGAQRIAGLLKDPEHVRSICIIAHVDHGELWVMIVVWHRRKFTCPGKTTLADALLACNGIISVRQSGKASLFYSSQSRKKVYCAFFFSRRAR